jgi:hypothetical protein
MTLTREQEKKVFVVLAAVLALLVVYRVMSAEKQKTAPLTYRPGAVAASPVRTGLSSPAVGTDPLLIFFAKREEKFPGVARDIFRMANPAPKPKAAPLPVGPPPPTVPEKTPEEIAAEASRADLAKFRFLGYLTDKENSLFLSKDGELFIVKSGETVQKNYKVKEAGIDHVVLVDTVTRVEVRIELTGGAAGADQGPQQRPMPSYPPPMFRPPVR